jgi:hypothetical protein
MKTSAIWSKIISQGIQVKPQPKGKTGRELTPEETAIILDPQLDYRAITAKTGVSRSYAWRMRREAGLIKTRT